jgi:hypothetical protein
MTAALAHSYISERMKELGHEGRYHLRLRHFVVDPLATRKIEAGLQLYILAEPKECIRIQSEMGIYDVAETAANELQYEHQGKMELTNYSTQVQHVLMIQVIFKTK